MRSLSLAFLFLLCIGYVQSANSQQCIPTCSVVDGRFLSIAGTDQSTIVGAEIVINLVSTGDALEFGVFDGDAAQNWDTVFTSPNRLELLFELHVDPMGDSSGLMTPAIATWTSDGSAGVNSGAPMNNNNWSDFMVANIQEAQSANGDFIYTLRITPTDESLDGQIGNNFKIRTTDQLYVPAFFPVAFIVPFIGQETPEFRIQDIMTMYPNATFNAGSVCGLPPGEFCDFNDPSCCLFETNYDGTWSFFMQVPPGETSLEVWDGDLDYGDINDNNVFDTDDPNTPGDPFLPPWSAGTDVVFQTARPADPNDNNGDSSLLLNVRDPSVQYFLISPLGESYQNFNPSGDLEWEVFRIDTTTDDPTVAEYEVPSIPPGVWEVRLIGVDMQNLNSILLPFDMNGDGMFPVDGPDARNVPTISGWGLLALALAIGLIGFAALRRRQVKA